MCGIAGIAKPASAGSPPSEDAIARMRTVLAHRGPDDAGTFVNETVALGHTRLSIVDPDSGQQPLISDDGSLVLVFNGEIYNFLEQRAALSAKGYSFSTHCDSEIIIRLYQEYGEECVQHLRGMFAFAIWDENRQELFLARDRLGIKPLYVRTDANGTLVFASEIKAILAEGSDRSQLDEQATVELLGNHAPTGERTMFDQITRLPAGHTLVWRDGKTVVDRYWEVSFSRPRTTSDANIVKTWGGMFEDAVESHLMSDVPLGVLLSGGIDSTAIAAVMRKKIDGRFKSFSVAFAEQEANELTYSRLAASAFDTDHHEVLLSADDFFRHIPRLIWHEDEPIAFSASVPLYVLCKKASEHVKVVLTGEGADELLAGYGWYSRSSVNLQLGRLYESIVPAGLRHHFYRKLAGRRSGLGHNKISRSFLARPATLEQLFLDNFGPFSRPEIIDLLHPAFRERLDGVDPHRYKKELLNDASSLSDLQKMLYIDCQVYLGELLMKQDQMSMAASIESRVPFLDRELVDYTLTLPDRFKLRKMTTKYVLRKAMAGVIPEEILKRPKMGFPVPLARWFRTTHYALLNSLIGEGRALERGVFSPDSVMKILREHHSGSVDHAAKLWALLNFELWYRQAFDGDSVEDCEAVIAAAV